MATWRRPPEGLPMVYRHATNKDIERLRLMSAAGDVSLAKADAALGYYQGFAVRWAKRLDLPFAPHGSRPRDRGGRYRRADPMSETEPCTECWGNGFVRKDNLGAFGDSFVRCETCGGSGRVDKVPEPVEKTEVDIDG